MKKYLIVFITVVSAVFLLNGCSDIDEEITTPPDEELSIHKQGILNPASDNFHGDLVQQNNWQMNTCQQCHGGDFSGGFTGASCLECHTQPAGPLACNTCHGDFSDPDRPAPPTDIAGNSDVTNAGVGAHSAHLYNNDLGSTVECSTCHIVPESVYAEGHVDSELPAEITFGNLAIHNIAQNPQYNPADNSCSDTYCHGNWEYEKVNADPDWQFMYTADVMSGNNASPVWNSGTPVECGSCHGITDEDVISPAGHVPVPNISACAACHVGVVDYQGNIIDTSLHMNGEVDIRDYSNIPVVIELKNKR